MAGTLPRSTARPVDLAPVATGAALTINDQRSPLNQIHSIIPRARVPELDKLLANLELLPQRLNSAKKDKMGSRQRALLKEFRQAGLLRDRPILF